MRTDLNRSLRPATPPPGLGHRAERPLARSQRSVTPIKWWAAVGALFVAGNVYLLVAWIASGDARPTPSGPDEVPAWMNTLGIVGQAISVALGVGLVLWFVIRPLWRRRTIPFDGLFLLAVISTYWQDPLVNYTQAWASYNANLVNLGSWAHHIPGWMSPNGDRFAEPLLFSFPGYVFFFFWGTLLACAMMRRAKARWPRMGKAGLVGVAFATVAVVDFTVEVTWLRTGLYAYGGSIPELTLFHGSYFQFPVYETVLFGSVWAAWAALRYFRDDRGRTLVERGADGLQVSTRVKTTLRLLALVAVLNVSYLAYNVVYQYFALHSGPWVQDVLDRSYLRSQLCGPGTDYACAGPAVPVHKRDAGHLDAEGRFVPAGVSGDE